MGASQTPQMQTQKRHSSLFCIVHYPMTLPEMITCVALNEPRRSARTGRETTTARTGEEPSIGARSLHLNEKAPVRGFLCAFN
jgi:hypothetical protein